MNSIKNEGKIYSACADGRVPFVSVSDIAAVAYRALTDSKPHNTEYRVLGPELLTHDEVCLLWLSQPIPFRHPLHIKDTADNFPRSQQSSAQAWGAKPYMSNSHRSKSRGDGSALGCLKMSPSSWRIWRCLLRKARRKGRTTLWRLLRERSQCHLMIG
jgi:hypothetical protein